MEKTQYVPRRVTNCLYKNTYAKGVHSDAIYKATSF